MAKGNRKRFNKSGRDQSLKTTVQSNVKILDGAQETHTENDSNALVIVRKKVVTQKAAPVARKLSKKKRKQLEKLLDQKEKIIVSLNFIRENTTSCFVLGTY